MDGLVSLFTFLIIGGVAGWIAGRLMKTRRMGLVANLILGVIGAVLGGVIFGIVGLKAYGFLAQVVMAVVGATALIGGVRWLGGPTGGRRQ